MRRRAISLLALPLLIAACGDSDDEPAARSDEAGTTTTAAGGDASTIELAAQGIAFDQTALTAGAGKVTIAFDNRDDGIRHSLHVTGAGVDEKTEIATGPTTQTLQLQLAQGTYAYFCDVHPEQMNGQLDVT